MLVADLPIPPTLGKYYKGDPSMDIYTVLSSKPHNPHYLNRYYKFISSIQNTDENGVLYELHHICPKASDLFPEYKSFKEHPWNKIKLTARQHFISHWMLAKAYGNSQTYAFWSMTTKQSRKSAKREYIVSSRVYEYSKKMQSETHSKIIKGTKNPTNSKIKRGMVHCYDSNNNFLIVTRSEFYARDDLKGVSTGNGEWCRSNEGRKFISENMSDREWVHDPNTMEHKFVKGSNLNRWIDKGYKIGYKMAYDRKSREKECPHCNKMIDPSNYSRWHGDNCKLKS